MLMRASLLLLLVGFVAACDAPATPYLEEPPAGPPPAELCKAVKDGLDKLTATGAVIIDEKGEAMVEQQVWFAMGAGGQQRLAQLLGFKSACGAPAKEKEVVIRNETGIVMLRQVVDTSLNPTAFLGADDGS